MVVPVMSSLNGSVLFCHNLRCIQPSNCNIDMQKMKITGLIMFMLNKEEFGLTFISNVLLEASMKDYQRRHGWR